MHGKHKACRKLAPEFKSGQISAALHCDSFLLTLCVEEEKEQGIVQLTASSHQGHGCCFLAPAPTPLRKFVQGSTGAKQSKAWEPTGRKSQAWEAGSLMIASARALPASLRAATHGTAKAPRHLLSTESSLRMGQCISLAQNKREGR